jgi:DNA-binding SARP family transcriptional activator
MHALRICLFGKFRIVEPKAGNILRIEPHKAEELFIYLLLHRDQPQSREHLADVLWRELGSEQSKSYLRKALWQLQSNLETIAGQNILLVDGDWLQINKDFDFWLDIDILKSAFMATQGIKGRNWDKKQVQTVQEAVASLEGDLLEGWYEDWILDERERLRHHYLTLLDKMMDYCEEHRQYEDGLLYGEQILFYDRAREHTHRRVIRLQYLSGNRTSALRQYKKCVETLRQELDVEPSEATRELVEKIRLDDLEYFLHPGEMPGKEPVEVGEDSLIRIFAHLSDFQKSLAALQTQLENDIQTIQDSLGHPS